jgi:hypothetical protein
LFSGCLEERLPAQGSFYFWRTTLSLSPIEQKALSDLHVKRLRIRLFDVVTDEKGIHPVGKLKGSPGPHPIAEVLPVVFLRERIFRGEAQVDSLAGRILSERDRICQENRLPCQGLELDCDWTPGSRQGFFELCRILGDSLHARGQALHSTLRLHQYHSPAQTGVPPVDRLTLMAYNMGPTTASPDRQSILDLKELSRWLETKSVYPKPLDVALPLYSWTLVVRNGKPIDLLQSVTRRELDAAPWLETQGQGLWRARTGAFLKGQWIRQDDTLKLESPEAKTLREAALLLSRVLPPQSDREVVFFDLSEGALAQHTLPDLRGLLERSGTVRQGH